MTNVVRTAADTTATLDAIGLVGTHLRDAAERLAIMTARASALSDGMNWQTDAATRFHTAASAWREELMALAGMADAMADDVARVRYRLLVETGGL